MKNRNRNRLLILELAMTGVYHSGINSSFIKLLKQVYPDIQDFIFYGEKSHLDICSGQIDENLISIKYKPIFLPKARLQTLIQRDILGCFYAIKTMLLSKKDDKLFFTYILPITHITVVLLNLLLKRKIFICLHGQMEAFIKETPLRYTKYYFQLETPFFKLNNRGYYILLGEAIQKEVGFLFTKSRVIVVDHPYNYANGSDKHLPMKMPLNIGQIGVGDFGKGTDIIFELAKLLEEEIKKGKLTLTVVGKLNENLHPLDNGLVQYFRKPLDADAFMLEINKLHYTLYLRNKKQGRAVASGSFFDTIKYTKPYISLDNLFITNYAERYPNTGVICSTIDEMATVIRNLVNQQDEIAYEKSLNALGEMRNELSISKIAASFSKQLIH